MIHINPNELFHDHNYVPVFYFGTWKLLTDCDSHFFTSCDVMKRLFFTEDPISTVEVRVSQVQPPKRHDSTSQSKTRLTADRIH